MLLKVGELAKHVGLTVRTLHHYDQIGLLSPSVRSEGGYRLYSRDDIKRLHRIQALKQFGCALEEIRSFMQEPGGSVLEVVEKQLEVLRLRVERTQALHGRLLRLREQLLRGEETGLTDWLTILEMMMTCEKYLSKKDLDTLLAKKAEGKLDRAFNRLAAAAGDCIARGLPPESGEAGEVAWNWVRLLKEMTGNDAGLAVKLRDISRQEGTTVIFGAMTPEVADYLTRAFAGARLAILARHLTMDELEGVRRRQAEHLGEWTTLIADFGRLMDGGAAPEDPAVQALARRWRDLFRASYSGDEPRLEEKIRAAFKREPDLLMGIGIDKRFMEFKEKAAMHLQRHEEDRKNTSALPSATALRVATLRAAHQLLDPPPVFVDPLALKILGEEEEQRLREDPESCNTPILKGLRASVALRSRLAEDEWARSERQGVRQYVILGAGLDTFAYRGANRTSEGSRVFEVDLPATQAWKRARLLAAGIAEPDRVVYVPVDFERETLLESLEQAGFQATAPAFFSWLGVTMYLGVDAILTTLGTIASLPPASGVVFDYAVSPAHLTPREKKARGILAARTAQGGEPWKTDFDPEALVEKLSALGFDTVETYDPERLQAMYLAGRTDGLRKSGVTMLVSARVGAGI